MEGEPLAWPLGDKYVPRLCPVCKREVYTGNKNKSVRSKSPHQFRMKYAKDFVHPWCWDLMMGEGYAVGQQR